MLTRRMGVLMFAALLLVLRAPIVNAADEERDDAQRVLDDQLARAMLAADRVAPAEGANKFHFSLQGMWLYGPVSGHMQTPSGGQPGTTSSKRPTLSEMGIDTASVFDAEFIGGIRDHELYLGGQWTWFSADATLGQTLVSHGSTFPAGTRVSSDHKVDWYRVGYRYRIQRGDEPGAELPLEIHSRVGAAIFDFHYRLDGSNGAEADRGYVKVAPQMGLELGWHATNKLSIEGEVTSTLPFSSMPWILTTQVVGKYTLWESGRLHLDGFLGAGYQKISFKDNQEVSNDINLDFGPMLMLGLEMRF